MNRLAKVEGTKIYARLSVEDEWVHVETVASVDDALWLACALEEDERKRADYIAEPLS